MNSINNIKEVSEVYRARIDGFEGRLFYENLLGSGPHVKTYFPMSPGEDADQYRRRPKIAAPVAKAIVDRISNVLNRNTVITASDGTSQNILDELDAELELSEFMRTMTVNTIATGANLVVMRVGEKYPQIENWDNMFITLENKAPGYEYTMKDGLILPVMSDDAKENDITRVLINDKTFGDVEHNLGFAPCVLTKNIDRYSSNRYGKSFIKRFDNIALEFNHILSQMVKSVKVLQNVWYTNLSVDNPERPVVLVPDVINFLGPDGVLSQAIRELDLTEERNLLAEFKHNISLASQVPVLYTGLSDTGKLPSGIALQIMFQPFTELMERLRPMYMRKYSELAEKLIRMKYAIDGRKAPKDLFVSVMLNDAILPVDRKERVDEVLALKKEGIITNEEARIILEPILKLESLNGQV